MFVWRIRSTGIRVGHGEEIDCGNERPPRECWSTVFLFRVWTKYLSSEECIHVWLLPTVDSMSKWVFTEFSVIVPCRRLLVQSPSHGLVSETLVLSNELQSYPCLITFKHSLDRPTNPWIFLLITFWPRFFYTLCPYTLLYDLIRASHF